MRLLLYTNILTPYRRYFYDLIYQQCQASGDVFEVWVMSESEPNRNWSYNDLKTDYTKLLEGRTIVKGEVYLHFNKNLSKQLKEFAPTVVVCAGSYLCKGIWKICSLKKRFNYKVVFWSESHLQEHKNYSSLKIKLREWIRKKIYNKFDGFWIAGKLSEQFVRNYNDSAPICFLPNLIEEKRYFQVNSFSPDRKKAIRTKYSVDNDKFLFVCPARLSPVKGIRDFILLFGDSSYKDQATILIAGDGELKEELENLIRSKNVDIKLLGYKNQEEVIELYSIADSFLMPSLSDPNPLTSIEALWSGLPLLVSSHVGNYPETVREGENGYVIRYENPKESIEKIDRLINSSVEWRTAAKQTSLAIARSVYGSEKKTQGAIKFLKGLANE